MSFQRRLESIFGNFIFQFHQWILAFARMTSNYIMIKITDKPISPQEVINKVRTSGSGCVAAYVGLIRDNSRGKHVLSVEYQDADGEAEARLGEIAEEIKRKFPVNKVAIYHRVGRLKVGDINLVVAIAAAHRTEGFAASQYAIDQFKEKLPTRKIETYQDGSVWAGE
jgi:molybdopterin synthase catalytic subunit